MLLSFEWRKTKLFNDERSVQKYNIGIDSFPSQLGKKR